MTLSADTISASLNEIYLFDADSLKFRFVNTGALKNLGFSLEQIAQVEPHYQDSAALAAQAWEKARLAKAYSRGVDSLGNGELEAAVGYLSWVVNCSPDFQDAADRLRRAQQQVRLAEMYRRGLDHYTQEQWEQAIQIFQAIIAADPGYRHALDMLKDSRQQLTVASGQAGGQAGAHRNGALGAWRGTEARRPAGAEAWVGTQSTDRRRTAGEEMYTRGGRAYDEGEPVQAELLVLDPAGADVRDLPARARLELDLQDLYDQGRANLRDESWEEAAECLRQVVDVRPSYRDARQLLERARFQGQMAGLYGQAARAWDDGRRAEALELFEQLMDLDPGYRDVARRLRRAR